MVSYYNTALYPQKHTATNLTYPAGQWQWPTNYHTPSNHQFLGEMEAPHAAHHQMYYNPHVFHTAAGAAAAVASDWHSPSSSAENFPQNAPSAHQMLHQHHPHHPHHHAIASGSGGAGAGTPSSASSGSSSSVTAGPSSSAGGHSAQLNESVSSLSEQHRQHQLQQQQQQHSNNSNIIAEGLPSPPITVSGSEISSPGAPASSSSPHRNPHHLNNNRNISPSAHNNNNNNNNTTAHNNNSNNNNNNLLLNQAPPANNNPVQFNWMKKPVYPAQPTPGTYTEAELCTTPSLEDFTELLDSSGKTRTKDKYRVVYTDYQRLELEKEYCTSRYITIRRKTELAEILALSERQVKIWFQNRRAKERKQNKKSSDHTSNTMASSSMHVDYSNLVDTKPKLELEPGLQHLQHSLHSMSSMAAMSMPSMSMSSMSMPSMSHLHHLHPHHPLAVSAAAAAHTHQLHQSQMSAAAAASVGTLPM